jgi:hypothetical protein
MLAKLAVAPEVLAERLQPPSLMKAIHLSLLETLKAHGEIIFRSNDEAGRFIRAAKTSALPVDIAKRWEVMLGTLHKSGRLKVAVPPDELSVSKLAQLSELKAAWSGKVQLIILDSDGAASLGVPDEEGVLNDTDANVELATIHSAVHTSVISHLVGLASSTVFPFDTRAAFWNEVLRPISEVSRTAKVLDKFLFKDVWSRADNPGRWRGRGPEHVVWLLNQLDQSMRPQSTVQLFTFAGPRDPGAEETAQILRKAWHPPASGRLSRVEISLARSDRNFPHDRHIRFDAGIGISINAGFDRLREDNIWDRYGMGWSYIHRPADLAKLQDREQGASRLEAVTETIFER